jgi:hypothetical protein
MGAMEPIFHMTLIRLYILALLTLYILAFAYILFVAWANGGIGESIKDGLMYGAVGGVFGLLAERTYKRLRRKQKHGD